MLEPVFLLTPSPVREFQVQYERRVQYGPAMGLVGDQCNLETTCSSASHVWRTVVAGGNSTHPLFYRKTDSRHDQDKHIDQDDHPRFVKNSTRAKAINLVKYNIQIFHLTTIV